MTHIGTFVYFGWFDARMNPYGIPGNLAVVVFRLIACTLVATMLWYGFESRILRLKRHFQNPRERTTEGAILFPLNPRISAEFSTSHLVAATSQFHVTSITPALTSGC